MRCLYEWGGKAQHNDFAASKLLYVILASYLDRQEYSSSQILHNT